DCETPCEGGGRRRCGDRYCATEGEGRRGGRDDSRDALDENRSHEELATISTEQFHRSTSVRRGKNRHADLPERPPVGGRRLVRGVRPADGGRCAPAALL